MLTWKKLRLLLSLVSLSALANAAPLVYGVTDSNQFGTVDVMSGAFQLINTTPNLQFGIVPGPNGFLSLSSNGLLISINPTNGVTSVIGDTGLGVLSSDIAAVGGTTYIIDTNNKLYAVNTATAALTLIGSTGIPGVVNPASAQYDDSLTGFGGSLYYTFDTTGVAPALYKINPLTGAAARVGPTLHGIDASVLVNGTFYVFDAVGGGPTTNQEFTLELGTGNTTFVTNIDPHATALFGAATVPEPASIALTGVGMVVLWVFRRLRTAVMNQDTE